MRTFGRIFGGIVVLLAAVAVAGIAILKSIDVNAYRGSIAEQVKAATGRDLSIDGEMELDVSLRPSVVLRDVSFANPPGMSRPQMATLRRLEARVELLPLIGGDIRINYLVLDGLDLRLERNGAGVGNWLLQGTASQANGTGGSGVIPVVQEVRLRNIALSYADEQSGAQRALQLDAVDLKTADGSNSLAFTASGNAQTLPFEASGELGSIAAMVGGASLPVKATVIVAGLTVGIAGTIAEPHAGKRLALTVDAKTEELAATAAGLRTLMPDAGEFRLPSRIGPLDASAKIVGAVDAMTASDVRVFIGSADSLLISVTGAIGDVLHFRQADLNVSVEGKDLSAFSDLAETPLPADKPFRLSGRLNDGDSAYGLDGLTFKAGNTAVSGWVTVTLRQPRPRLEAQLLADLLDVNDLPLPLARKTPAPPAGRILSAEPLALDGLTAVDADVSFQARRLLAQGLILSEVESQIRLDKGVLAAKPFKATVAGGQAQGTVVLDGSDPAGAALDLHLSMAGVQAGLLARDLANSDLLEGGPLDVRIDLTGKGRSQQALAAALTGDVRATMGPGRVRNSALDTMGADVGMTAIRALNPLAKEEAFTQITCGAARFVVARGKAVADRGLAVETEKMVVVGSGQVDLASEQIDFVIKPEAREGLGITLGGAASMVRLTGTVSQPSIGLDSTEAAKKALSVGAAIATGGISLLAEGLLGRATQDGSPCRTAMGGTSPKSPAPVAPAPARAAPATPQPKDEGGFGGLLKGFGKSIDETLGGKRP